MMGCVLIPIEIFTVQLEEGEKEMEEWIGILIQCNVYIIIIIIIIFILAYIVQTDR